MNDGRAHNSEKEVYATYAESLLRLSSGIWFGFGLALLFSSVPGRTVQFFLSSGLDLSDDLLMICVSALFAYFTWSIGVSTWEFFKEHGLARKSSQLPSKPVFRKSQTKGWLIFIALLTWVILFENGAPSVEATLDLTPFESFVSKCFLLYSPTIVMSALAVLLIVDFRKGYRLSEKRT